MSGITDTATVTLNVNGAQAKQMMSDIEAKIKQTEAKITSLKKNMADPKDVEKARKQLKTYQKQLDEMKSATEGVNKALGNLDTATPRQLERALRTLNKQMKDMTPGTEVWNSHVEKIRELKSRLADLKDEVKSQESTWTRFKSWATGAWPAIDLLTQWGGSINDVMRGFVDAYASIDQEMANVRKFTGMTEEQVASLNEQFKSIDTRSSREQLNRLAQEAGRLGKTSEEDVLGFVRAADKINVALDDLGDGATLTLSKLTGIFGDEERYGTEQSLLKVGSVINDLSQNCSASAPYLANFAERLGGVGAQAGFSISEIMGFGAVLDSNSQAVEASATALSQIIVRLYQDPAKYARVAGLDAQEFANLMREDANAALILFLETLQKAGGMDVLSPMFKDMGETGSRAIEALSTLATHIDQVKAQQEAANVAFAEGTSIDKEFAVQNGTVQASIEKAQKRFQELRIEIGEKLAPLMQYVFTSGSAMTKAMSFLIDIIYKNRTAVVSIAAAIAAYNMIMLVYNTRTMLATKATALFHGAINLCSGIIPALRLLIVPLINTVQYFSNGLQVNYAMQQRWRRSMEAMKFSSWAGLILAVGAAVYTLANRWKSAAEEAEKARKKSEEYKRKLTDLDKASAEYCAKEIDRIDALYKAATDEAKSKDERKAAAERLQDLYPDYFKNLSIEEIMVGDAKIAYDKLRDSIIEVARARAAAAKIEENEKELLTLEQQAPGLKATRDRDKAAYDTAVSELEEARREESYSSSGYGNSTDAAVGHMVDVAPYAQKVASTGQTYSASETAYQDNLTKQRQLNEANQSLRDKYNISAEALTDSKNPDVPLTFTGGAAGSGDTGSGATADKFAAENAWRERQEADARIAYAKGEATFAEHTARMAAIAADYYQMLLDRDDLSADERLKIQADYWEAVNKETVSGNKYLLDEEDRNYQDLLDRLRSNHEARLNQEGLSAAERQQEAEYYAEVLELAELQHLQNIRNLYEEGSDEWLAADRKFQEKQLAARERHLERMEDLERTYSSMKTKFFGLNQEEKDAEFNKQFNLLKEVYNQELAAVGDNEAEKLRLKEAFMAAELSMREEYNQKGAEDSVSAYEKAIDKAAKWLNSDGGKALAGTLSTLTSGMSSIFSGLSSMIQAELEIQTAGIEKRYDREIEMAQGNSYKVAKLEKKKEAEIAKLKNEANRKMFAMQVIQAVAQTAQNALSAFGSAAAIPVVGHIIAPIAAAMAIAAGAIQIATIKKQQQAAESKGYSKGGFTKPGAVDEPAGVVHAGEWVASQKLLANPVARPMIDALDYAQRTNTIGSLRPDDVSRSITANNSLVRIAEGDSSSALMVAAAVQMSRTVDNLTDRLNEPFVTVNTVTGDKGIKQAQDEYSRLMNNVTPKSKRK